MLIEKIHYNKPQLKSALVLAPEEWAVLARGTGKTKGILAFKSSYNLDTMPRCTGVVVGATFQQILTRTLPPLVAGWEKLGYKYGTHFIIGQKPPQKWRDMWNWQGPYHMPFDFQYFISWWNGAGVQLVSQDRAGSSNGVSIDWIVGDEAKLLHEKRLKEELFPANRGIHLEHANNPHLHGKTFTTDMPVGTAGRWILDKEKEMDLERYQAIVTILNKVYVLKLELKIATTNKQREHIHARIKSGEQMLNLLRRNFVFYHEATALDNIDALGVDYIKEELRSLSKFEFSTSIMNKKPYKLEDGFYPMLKEEHHGYFDYDYHEYDKIGYDFELLSKLDDCRKDGDIIAGQPLHISLDYNRRIWPIVTGQPIPGGINEMRTLSAMHVLYPKGLKDSLKQWHEYYKYHDRHEVILWYDHTAYSQIVSNFMEETREALESLGWSVTVKYIGKTTDQDVRYTLFYDLLAENDKYDWVLRFNRDNCKFLLLSMFQAQAIERGESFKKNKATERDPKFPAEESTHYTDAWDNLVYGVIFSGESYAIDQEVNQIELR